jgi:hypothetical protein
MNNLLSLSVAQLRRAVAIKEQIESLEAELAVVLGSTPLPSDAAGVAPAHNKKKVMSPEARAKIAATQKARWVSLRAAKGQPAITKTGKTAKRTISAEARKKMAEGAKSRWAKIKAANQK